MSPEWSPRRRCEPLTRHHPLVADQLDHHGTVSLRAMCLRYRVVIEASPDRFTHPGHSDPVAAAIGVEDVELRSWGNEGAATDPDEAEPPGAYQETAAVSRVLPRVAARSASAVRTVTDPKHLPDAAPSYDEDLPSVERDDTRDGTQMSGDPADPAVPKCAESDGPIAHSRAGF